MANHVKMAKVHTILTLRVQGWSFRRIGRELGMRVLALLGGFPSDTARVW